MENQLTALLDRSESLKQDLENAMAQMGDGGNGERAESLQAIRDSILEQLDRAICGVTALMAWEDGDN